MKTLGMMMGALFLATQFTFAEPPKAPLPSKVDLPTAVSCFSSLEKARGASISYPPGYVAIAGQHANKGGAFLFNSRSVKFYPEIQATEHGDFMEFWGETEADFTVPVTSGVDALGDQSRGYFTEELIVRMQKLFAVLKKNSEAKKQDKKALTPEEQQKMKRVLAEALGDLVKGTPKTGQKPAQAPKKQPGNDPTKEIDQHWRAWAEMGPEVINVTAEGLIEALNSCTKVKNEPRITTLAAQLKAQIKPTQTGKPNGTQSPAGAKAAE